VNRAALARLLEALAAGELDVGAALGRLEALPFDELEDFAKIDHHRELRHGVPEVVFGQGKTPEQQARIAASIVGAGQDLLVTRTGPAAFAEIVRIVPSAVFHETARAITARVQAPPVLPGRIGILAAGTSDLPVAEEAAVTAEALGAASERFYDVGVAGLHRLLAHHARLRECSVLIVVAGMEGALPSVVGGLVGQPVIAVPTSVGYGASFGGLAALLGMLSSCAPGLVVTNIDNGFGAAFAACRILRMAGALSPQPPRAS
jgi:pyridinium-3,5-biscarboxylic acid mononucleotide synthase